MSRLPVFQPRDHYRPHADGYRLLPFRFMRWPDGEVLLVNDVGELVFLGSADFRDFMEHRLTRNHEKVHTRNLLKQC